MRLKFAVVFLPALIVNVAAAADDPNALWRIVHEQCAVHSEQFGTPLPCAAIDESRGYAILKDRNGASQFLLIATARVSGMEDPALLAPNAPNYWQAAWEHRNLVEAMLSHALAPDALSLAINSSEHRTQNQFHIHIDCVSHAVRAALATNGAAIHDTWGPFPVPLAGHPYRAMRVLTLTRPGASPMQLLAQLIDPQSDMRSESLVVVGATFASGETGFYLLETRAGGGEELQDHSCAVAGAG